MTANSSARDHLNNFRWNQGNPDLTSEEAQLMDLRALKDELEELIALRVRDSIEVRKITWQKVGKIFGISHQGAMHKWKRKPTS